MAEPRGDWRDLFRAFLIGADPRKLWLALRGIILSCLLVVVTVGSIACVEDVLNVRFTVEDELGADGNPTGYVSVKRRNFTEVGWRGVKEVLPTDVWGAVLRAQPAQAVRRTVVFAEAIARSAWTDVRRRVLVDGDGWTNVAGLLARSTSLLEVLALLVANGILLLLVWSYYGGAIMRIAAVEYALGERIELRSATAYAWRKHGCLFGAPFGMLLILAGLGLAILLLGALAWNVLVVAVAVAGLLATGVVAGIVQDRAHSGKVGMAAGVVLLALLTTACVALSRAGVTVPYVGQILLAVLSPLAALASVAMALIGIWLLLGTGLMFAAVAAEDADTFQAWARSCSALCRQIWRFLGYCIITSAYGALCIGFACLVRLAAWWFLLVCLSPALGNTVEIARWLSAETSPEPGSGAGVLLFVLRANDFVLDLAVISLVVTFMASATTIVYFLLRKHSDGRPVTEVHLEPRDRRLLIAAPFESDDEETARESDEGV
jgi:hypothetical protein